jgi:hypothetical protein
MIPEVRRILKFLLLLVGVPACVLFVSFMVTGLLEIDSIYMRMCWGLTIVIWAFVALKLSSVDITKK